MYDHDQSSIAPLAEDNDPPFDVPDHPEDDSDPIEPYNDQDTPENDPQIRAS